MRAIHKIATALLGLAAFSVTPAQAVEDQADITIKTELGQNAYLTKKGEKTYLRIDLEGIRHAHTERTPVNIAIVIDKSGSMGGNKIAQAKEAAIMAVERLGKQDYVSIITYSDNVDVLIPSSKVNNHTEFRHKINTIRSNGRTALYAGTKRGIRELEAFLDENKVNRVILLSDGLANIGPSKPQDLEDLGRLAAKKGISVTTIGLGLGYNEDLMTKLAYASDGNHAFVRNERDLVDIFNKEFGDVLSVVAQDVDIFIECEIGFRPRRVLGRHAEIDGQKVRLNINQLYGAQEKHIIVEIEIADDVAVGTKPLANVRVDYRSMKQKRRQKLSRNAEINFTSSKDEAERSTNKRVMSGVIEQIATERNERAVALRDKGKVKEAKKALEENAAYLRSKARSLGGVFASPLNKMAEKNKFDSENLEGRNWTANRKDMKARQYRKKTQQSY